LLKKGLKVYVEGRIQTRTYTGQDNVQKTKTEIIIEDMMILTPKRDEVTTPVSPEPPVVTEPPKDEPKTENVDASDIPF
ncbi:MAG: single-stranded DNA-binding protein, partial [Patescibacteria group bacterium]